MRERTTSRVMGADRLYGEFHYCYSISPEYFGFSFRLLRIKQRELKNAFNNAVEDDDICLIQRAMKIGKNIKNYMLATF
jgi:hypothetical protein